MAPKAPESSRPPAPWADTPHALIPVPDGGHDKSLHSSVYCSAEMASAHNLLIRGLNTIELQAPLIPSTGQSGYRAQDVKDLLYYVRAWCKSVHHHHDGEEEVMFPAIERLTHRPGLLTVAVEQHQLFHDGLTRFEAYASGTTPEQYRWAGEGGMKEVIDGFSGPLLTHLNDEIKLFQGFGDLDSAKLREAWDIGEKAAKSSAKISLLYDMFPCVVGCADRTCKGSEFFPPVPFFVPYLIKWWFGRNNGAWRFNPSDFWGQPRPLHFVAGSARPT